MAMLHPNVMKTLREDPAFVLIETNLRDYYGQLVVDDENEAVTETAGLIAGALADGGFLVEAATVDAVQERARNCFNGYRNFRATGGCGGKPLSLWIYDDLIGAGLLRKHVK